MNNNKKFCNNSFPVFQLLCLAAGMFQCIDCGNFLPRSAGECPVHHRTQLDWIAINLTSHNPFLCTTNNTPSDNFPCGVSYMAGDTRLNAGKMREVYRTRHVVDHDDVCPDCDDRRPDALSKQRDMLLDFLQSYIAISTNSPPGLILEQVHLAVAEMNGVNTDKARQGVPDAKAHPIMKLTPETWFRLTHQILSSGKITLGPGDNHAVRKVHETGPGSMIVTHCTVAPKLPSTLTWLSSGVQIEGVIPSILLAGARLGSYGRPDSVERNLTTVECALRHSIPMCLTETMTTVAPDQTGTPLQAIRLGTGHESRVAQENWYKQYENMCQLSLNRSVQESNMSSTVQVQPCRSDTVQVQSKGSLGPEIKVKPRNDQPKSYATAASAASRDPIPNVAPSLAKNAIVNRLVNQVKPTTIQSDEVHMELESSPAPGLPAPAAEREPAAPGCILTDSKTTTETTTKDSCPNFSNPPPQLPAPPRAAAPGHNTGSSRWASNPVPPPNTGRHGGVPRGRHATVDDLRWGPPPCGQEAYRGARRGTHRPEKGFAGHPRAPVASRYKWNPTYDQTFQNSRQYQVKRDRSSSSSRPNYPSSREFYPPQKAAKTVQNAQLPSLLNINPESLVHPLTPQPNLPIHPATEGQTDQKMTQETSTPGQRPNDTDISNAGLANAMKALESLKTFIQQQGQTGDGMAAVSGTPSAALANSEMNAADVSMSSQNSMSSHHISKNRQQSLQKASNKAKLATLRPKELSEFFHQKFITTSQQARDGRCWHKCDRKCATHCQGQFSNVYFVL